MEWKEIKRDKDGFATEECLDEMFKNDSILVRGVSILFDDEYTVINSEDYEDWRGDIDRNAEYTHYLPIPKLKL